MSQTKFKLNSEEQEHKVTHAHTQEVKKPISTPSSSKGIPLLSGAKLSVHLIRLFEILTPLQKQQLVDYATENDKTASCVIKELLEKEGIIQS